MAPLFGPSGNSDIFYAQGYKRSAQAPAWLNEMGLNAYEYSFGQGVRLRQETAEELRAELQKYDIATSVHAPYYINLANDDPQKRLASLEYLRRSAEAATWMGAKRVIFHTGSSSGKEKDAAMELALAEMEHIVDEIMSVYPEMLFCPETMGKHSQLGTVEDIVALCQVHEHFIPTLDFGHINALGQGSLKTEEDFSAVLDAVEKGLGREKLQHVHIHFSRVEYSKAGERRHLTFEDTQFGPDFHPLAKLIAQRGLEPVVICESKGTMAEDAAAMKKMYEEACANNE